MKLLVFVTFTSLAIGAHGTLFEEEEEAATKQCMQDFYDEDVVENASTSAEVTGHIARVFDCILRRLDILMPDNKLYTKKIDIYIEGVKQDCETKNDICEYIAVLQELKDCALNAKPDSRIVSEYPVAEAVLLCILDNNSSEESEESV